MEFIAGFISVSVLFSSFKLQIKSGLIPLVNPRQFSSRLVSDVSVCNENVDDVRWRICPLRVSLVGTRPKYIRGATRTWSRRTRRVFNAHRKSPDSRYIMQVTHPLPATTIAVRDSLYTPLPLRLL